MQTLWPNDTAQRPPGTNPDKTTEHIETTLLRRRSAAATGSARLRYRTNQTAARRQVLLLHHRNFPRSTWAALLADVTALALFPQPTRPNNTSSPARPGTTQAN